MASSSSSQGMGDQVSLKRVIFAAATGTMIEWYDFFIFGSLTTVLSLKFYPPGNDTFALIAYLATFAVGFLVRPFGALFFGRIGDMIGRRLAFIITLSVMGMATALIGTAAHVSNRRMVLSHHSHCHSRAPGPRSWR